MDATRPSLLPGLALFLSLLFAGGVMASADPMPAGDQWLVLPSQVRQERVPAGPRFPAGRALLLASPVQLRPFGPLAEVFRNKLSLRPSELPPVGIRAEGCRHGTVCRRDGVGGLKGIRPTVCQPDPVANDEDRLAVTQRVQRRHTQIRRQLNIRAHADADSRTCVDPSMG